LRNVIGDNQSLREDVDYKTVRIRQVRALRALQRAERLVGAVIRREEEQR